MAAFASFEEGDEDRMRDMMGPGQADTCIRQALQMLWMSLPRSKKNPDDVECEFRRLVDRALRDMREDFDAFRGDAG
ncbi:MAG: hypothetical protein IT445_05990 [Phycisphaeraceae bacterium]|nr:hypothetical protein [Phycisphaeraceae bacterium]